MLQASLNGATYALQPGWAVSKASGGAAGFTPDAQGHVVYLDSTGNQQTLYPAFADLAQLVAAFKGVDANLSATGNVNGPVTVKFLGKIYTLTPDYAVIPVPVAHAKDTWWVGWQRQGVHQEQRRQDGARVWRQIENRRSASFICGHLRVAVFSSDREMARVVHPNKGCSMPGLPCQ